ncbi:hypothetical protein [Pelagibaculum spongiae]|uniref:Uncharacterized protein n=1 Tax=Pelagibaculum spongiae TaxID=2080658 RepID=A0A2V1H2I4_9GAMM|nr:hypothetical protein [Pelagibaculum spongiae]PVZ70662.1 hypothetical protein DC094_08795 [Pelagibaculum spongiae]
MQATKVNCSMPFSKRKKSNRPHSLQRSRSYRGWGNPNAGKFKTFLRLLWDFIALPLLFGFTAYGLVGVLLLGLRNNKQGDWMNVFNILFVLTFHFARGLFSRAALAAPNESHFQIEPNNSNNSHFISKQIARELPLLIHIPSRVLSRYLSIYLLLQADVASGSGSGSGSGFDLASGSAIGQEAFEIDASIQQDILFFSTNIFIAATSVFALGRIFQTLRILIQKKNITEHSQFRSHPQFSCVEIKKQFLSGYGISNLIGYSLALAPACVGLAAFGPAAIIRDLTSKDVDPVVAVLVAELISSTAIFGSWQLGRPVATLLRRGSKCLLPVLKNIQDSWRESHHLPRLNTTSHSGEHELQEVIVQKIGMTSRQNSSDSSNTTTTDLNISRSSSQQMLIRDFSRQNSSNSSSNINLTLSNLVVFQVSALNNSVSASENTLDESAANSTIELSQSGRLPTFHSHNEFLRTHSAPNLTQNSLQPSKRKRLLSEIAEESTDTNPDITPPSSLTSLRRSDSTPSMLIAHLDTVERQVKEHITDNSV